MRLRLAGSLAVLVGVNLVPGLASPVPAFGHDHRPPNVVLRGAKARQLGLGYHVWWVYRDDDACVASERTGPRTFPTSSLGVPAATKKVRIRFLKEQKPRRIVLRAWHELDVDGNPVGPAEEVSFKLKKQQLDERTVWDAVFEPPVAGDYYVEASLRWRDVEGCKSSEGGYWTFHLAVIAAS